MKEETPFENCCAKLENFRAGCVEKSKNVLFEFSGCRVTFEICSYEVDERFETGLVIFGVVFN